MKNLLKILILPFKFFYQNYLESWSQRIGTIMGIIIAIPYAFHQFTLVGGLMWFLLGLVISVVLIYVVTKRKQSKEQN